MSPANLVPSLTAVPHDVDDSHPEELSIDAVGADEVAVVPWPLMLRERVIERMADSPRYPWIVLSVALFGLTYLVQRLVIPWHAGEHRRG